MTNAEVSIIPSLAILSDDWEIDDLRDLADSHLLKTAGRLTTTSRYSYSERNRLKKKFRYETDPRGDILRYLHKIYVDIDNLVSYIMTPHHDTRWLRYAISGRC